MQSRPRLEQVLRRAEAVRTGGEPWSDVRRILVVRHDRLGDVVLTIPAVAALRVAYPRAWIGFFVRPRLAPLARMVEGVDEVVEDPGSRKARVASLRAFKPDLAVCVSPGGAMPVTAAIAGVRHRVGSGFRLYSPLFERTVDERRRTAGRHEVEYALSYAHRSGAPASEARFPLRIPDEAVESRERWLESQRLEPPYVVIHPGTGGSCPAWPLGHFLRLAALLRAEDRRVVVSIGPGDEAVAHGLDDAEPAVRRLPRFSGGLPALAACLSGASLVVSNSTGPLHLAAAVGAPALAFHAPWPSCGVSRWGPYAENGWGLVAGLDTTDGTWSRSERRRKGGDLMATISPAAALTCALALLESRPPILG